MVDDDPTNGKGYESAVAYAVAEKLGYTKDQVTWVRVHFDEALADPRASTSTSTSSRSPTTARRSSTSRPATTTSPRPSITVKGSPIAAATTLADLKDAKLGAMIGTTSLDAIADVIAPTKQPAVFDDNDAGRARRCRTARSTAWSSTCRRRSTWPVPSSTTAWCVGQLPGTADADRAVRPAAGQGLPADRVRHPARSTRSAPTARWTSWRHQWLTGEGAAPVLK